MIANSPSELAIKHSPTETIRRRDPDKLGPFFLPLLFCRNAPRRTDSVKRGLVEIICFLTACYSIWSRKKTSPRLAEEATHHGVMRRCSSARPGWMQKRRRRSYARPGGDAQVSYGGDRLQAGSRMSSCRRKYALAKVRSCPTASPTRLTRRRAALPGQQPR